MNKYRGDGTKTTDPASVPPDLPPVPFEPLGNLVILELVPQGKSPGGISLPETVAELGEAGAALEPPKAWVVAVGCQCRYARRGDLVVLNGQLVNFRWKGERLWAIMETQILGVVQDERGVMPTFKVVDWKEGIVVREGEQYVPEVGKFLHECNALSHTARG